MNVTCPSCQTVYRVDPAKVPAEGVRARCTTCGAVFPVSRAPERAAPPEPTGSPLVPPSPARSAVQTAPQPAQPPPPRPPAAPPTAPPVVPPARPQPVAAPPVAVPIRPAAPPSVPPKPATAGPGVRPPVNPFLAQDPQQKARRLARALISDLVVYHPDKRQEGLRNGTLKELFDDEIKKSWEEYTEQVGQPLAQSTSYFNDALNEILGDGRKIF